MRVSTIHSLCVPSTEIDVFWFGGHADNDAIIVPEGTEMPMKFAKYAPHFTGPITPAESVEKCLDVLEKTSVENGDSGAFVSHLGNKQWL